MKGGSWSFDNYLLSLGSMPVGVSNQNIPLFTVDFWVQAYNLPIGFMNGMVGALEIISENFWSMIKPITQVFGGTRKGSRSV